jgi:hypothetical protein
MSGVSKIVLMTFYSNTYSDKSNYFSKLLHPTLGYKVLTNIAPYCLELRVSIFMMRIFNIPTLARTELRLRYKRRCRSVSEYIHYLWLVQGWMFASEPLPFKIDTINSYLHLYSLLFGWKNENTLNCLTVFL